MDTASRLTSETRTFNGVSGNFTLNYVYNPLGQLTEITNPWNVKVGYAYNMAGEMTGVTGQNYGGVTSYASGLVYRAFGGLKQMNYANGRSLSLSYNNRMFLTQYSIPNVMRWNYAYNYFNENTGRVTYAQNLTDPTLDRSYDYDHVGRATHFTSGSNARHHTGQGGSILNDGPYSHSYSFDVWGNRTYIEGWGGIGRVEATTYTNNRRSGYIYDAAGNLTNELGQTFTYDATGQQATANYSGYSLQQVYDGDRLRVKKVENGTTTYYLRSTVLGGQIVAELNSSGTMTRGFVYQGSQLLAVQQTNQVSWVHEDPVAKSKRVTDSSGNVVSMVELDPWGGDTTRSSNEAFQPRRFTSYDRDGNGSDEAMHRRYNRWHMRFDQPDPYGGSYDMTDPQSFNRYSYVQNDPVNFIDPLGLNLQDPLGPPPPMRPGPQEPPPPPEPTGPLDTIITNTWDRRPGSATGGDTQFRTEAPPYDGDGPTGAELVPQNPIQAANQDPNCLTINKLLANSRITRAFDAAWEATKKSGKENGGWVFSDENYPTDVFVHQAPEGTEEYMKGEPEAFKELLKTLPTSRPRRFILDYHTHKFSPLPGSDIWARASGLKRGSIGVIVHNGQYTFYNANKIIPPSEYNNCL